VEEDAGGEITRTLEAFRSFEWARDVLRASLSKNLLAQRNLSVMASYDRGIEDSLRSMSPILISHGPKA